MKILVTGAYGQLGSEILRICATFPALDIIASDVDTLDITDSRAVEKFIAANRPGYLINCAAYTAVDKAEDDLARATLLNSVAPGIVASACSKAGIKLIHISTDYVFDGQGNMPYKEDDPVNPLGVYGKTKYEGEINCLQNNPETVIIRTSWLYSSFGTNFVKTMIRLGKEKDTLNVVSDQVGSPTYARDLALAILTIVNNSLTSEPAFVPGVYHYSNEGVCSWYDLAVAIHKIAGIQCVVTPVSSENFITRAKRPHFSVLDKSKIKAVFHPEIPFWQDSLKDCISILIKEQINGK